MTPRPEDSGTNVRFLWVSRILVRATSASYPPEELPWLHLLALKLGLRLPRVSRRS
jgi:hypothetical protein